LGQFSKVFLILKHLIVICHIKELRDKLIQAAVFNQPIKRDHPLWIEALQAYRADTGDFNANLSCGSCVNKIKRWLEK
jgi:hypothetical protein